jgi:hypothetical protein
VPNTVRTILQEQEVQPHKVRYYLERRDSAFDERLAAVVEVYQAAQQLQGCRRLLPRPRTGRRSRTGIRQFSGIMNTNGWAP